MPENPAPTSLPIDIFPGDYNIPPAADPRLVLTHDVLSRTRVEKVTDRPPRLFIPWFRILLALAILVLSLVFITNYLPRFKLPFFHPTAAILLTSASKSFIESGQTRFNLSLAVQKSESGSSPLKLNITGTAKFSDGDNVVVSAVGTGSPELDFELVKINNLGFIKFTRLSPAALAFLNIASSNPSVIINRWLTYDPSDSLPLENPAEFFQSFIKSHSSDPVASENPAVFRIDVKPTANEITAASRLLAGLIPPLLSISDGTFQDPIVNFWLDSRTGFPQKINLSFIYRPTSLTSPPFLTALSLDMSPSSDSLNLATPDSLLTWSEGLQLLSNAADFNTLQKNRQQVAEIKAQILTVGQISDIYYRQKHTYPSSLTDLITAGLLKNAADFSQYQVKIKLPRTFSGLIVYVAYPDPGRTGKQYYTYTTQSKNIRYLSQTELDSL